MPFSVATYATTATKSGRDKTVAKDAHARARHAAHDHAINIRLVEAPARQARSATRSAS